MFTAIKLFFANWQLYIVGGIIAALLLAVGIQTIRLDGEQVKFADLEAAVQRNDSAQKSQYVADILVYRKREQELQTKANTITKESNEKVKTLNASVAALDYQLRNRPPRPASNADSGPGDAAASAGRLDVGTGAGLYREDSIFLVGDAAAAAKLGIERDACRKLYNEARATVAQPLPASGK